jgi:hypothetical protein
MQQACNTYHSYHNEHRELETSLNDIKKKETSLNSKQDMLLSNKITQRSYSLDFGN